MRALTAGLVAGVLLAACSGGADGPTDGTPTGGQTSPTGGAAADEVVALLDVAGGFVPVEHALGDLPEVVVYGDGTVLASRGDGSISTLGLTGDELSDLVDFLDDADLGRFPAQVEPDGPVTIADAPSTTIEVHLASGTHTVGAYALGFEGLDYPDALEDVSRRLTGLADRVRADGDLWTPARGRVIVSGAPGDVAAADPWPEALPVPDGLESASPQQPATATAEGDAIDAALIAFSQSTIRPLVAPSGEAYLVTWRPLLPHEAD